MIHILSQYSHVVSIHVCSMLHASTSNLYCIQTMKCETSALDITGMLWAGVLDVITVRVMTNRID